MFLLDIFFPKRCLGCGRVGSYFCSKCTINIHPIKSNEAICPVCEKPAIDGRTHPRCQGRYTPEGLISFFRYEGPIRKAIKVIKYRSVSDIINAFVDLIPRTSHNYILDKIIPPSTIMVPIPLHPKRLLERGFNQAELLSRQLGQMLRISVRTDILRRIQNSEPQVSMKDRISRLNNMHGMFSINRLTIPDRRLTVLLVDDVFTTGATMRSAAAVLKRSGVKSVWAVTMAR